MLRHLILVEVVSKLVTGLLLLFTPKLTLNLAGLPHQEEAFWARLLGAGLIGMAIASFIDVQLPSARGLGLAGSIAINLSLAGGITLQLALSSDALTRRGRVLLVTICGLLVAISLIEIAFIG